MTVRIIECTNPTGLHCHYNGQTSAQPAYIELDLREGTLHATYNGEIGNAVPGTVYHGFQRRYTIPVLTGQAANEAMARIAPLADRMLADWKEVWDGNNMVARLGEDAQAAEEEIEEELGCNIGYGDIDADTQGFDEADLVQEWDVDAIVDGNEVEEHGITADTTDTRLEAIAEGFLQELAGDGGVAVCDGLVGYLQGLRDELAEEDPLTAAEMHSIREYLGVTGDHMAKLLGVNPRTLRSWESGRDPVPGRIRPEMAELVEETDQQVAELTAWAQDQDGPTLTVYRSDEEYQASKPGWPGARWSASWHRRVCARVAAATGARLEYAEPEDASDEVAR